LTELTLIYRHILRFTGRKDRVDKTCDTYAWQTLFKCKAFSSYIGNIKQILDRQTKSTFEKV